MMTANNHLLRLAWMIDFVLATGSCAATVSLMPQTLEVEAEQFSPPPEKANTYITRKSSVAMTVLFQVHLDRKLAGSIAPDTYLLFEVEPGTHQIAVLTQESQATMTITARSGDNYFVDVVPKFGWNRAQAELEELTQEDGRKTVQNAKRAEALSFRP